MLAAILFICGAMTVQARVMATGDLETVVVDGVNYNVLRSQADWEKFTQMVEDAKGNADVNAIMDADFEAHNLCGGSESYPYRGVFNGNGHTLAVGIGSGNGDMAPFSHVKDCTIRDLHVTGQINGYRHSAGLIAHCVGSPTVHVERVWVSTYVNGRERYAGGIIGHADQADIYMDDCLFDGTVVNNGSNLASYGGMIIGWSNNGGHWYLNRVYGNGSIEGSQSMAFGFNQDGTAWGTNSNSFTVTSADWSNVNQSKKTDQNEVVSIMNDRRDGTWQLVDGKAVPVMKTWPVAGDVSFDLYDMVPGTESGEEGMLKIPFSCDQPVEYIEVSYTDENGGFHNLGRTTFSSNTYAGFIKVPATEQHHDLTVKAKLAVGSVTVKMDEKNDAVMHHPLHLQAEMLRYKKDSLMNAGVVQLTWQTREPQYADVVDGDQFAVYRSLTGNMEDMVPVGSVPLDETASAYTFRDETLLSALTSEQLAQDALQATYIVVRASAQQLWGLSNNVTSAKVSTPIDMLHLLRVKDWSAQWEDETARTVNVKWQYADEYGAVWDDRAQMKMLVTTTNRDGAAVDSTTYVLTTDEMNAQTKTIQLNRSCVNYKIEIFAESGESLIPADANYFQINNTDDWATFTNNVKASRRQNVSLNIDVTITEKVGGTFQGVFEGNGHTLTYNPTSTDGNLAPFARMGNATVRNLHVAGAITSSGAGNGGLVETLNAPIVVENCRVSISFNFTKSGDVTSGGFTGHIGYNEITFRNCVFDGSFTGYQANSIGGFVGYTHRNVTVENCLFAPTAINTQFDGCETWARIHSPGNLISTNSHSTVEYSAATEHDGYFIINNAADWTTFVNKVEAAGGNSDVNAILNADITITAPAGYNNIYRGTFDGNGHTLNANLSATTSDIAPFVKANRFTIKNLHVTGSISGQADVAGLVAYSHKSSTDHNYIFNCRVSAALTGTKSESSVAGLIADNRYGTVTITNCLFDGSITSANRAASMVISTDGSTSVDIHNCLEKGTYTDLYNFTYYCCFLLNTSWRDERYALPENNNWGYQSFMGEHTIGSMSAENLVTQLGVNNWRVENGEVVPLLYTRVYSVGGDVYGKPGNEVVTLLGADQWTMDADYNVIPKTIDKAQETVVKNPTLPTFYYENHGEIDKNSLEAQTLPTSVVLTWANESDEPVDYYEVWRTDAKDATQTWKCIATQLTDMQYEDKTTSPVHQYKYKVRGVTSCEGLTWNETKEVEGMCVQTATVEGYLRFLDGTGIPGETVVITQGSSEQATVTTDDSGYFRFTLLPYVNSTETQYSLTVRGMGMDPVVVLFGIEPGDNVVTGVVIEMGESVKFAGNIMYSGTSIPVQGVHFLVDGHEVRNAAGLITTDHEGKYAFRMLKKAHTIQAVKDGHTFLKDGYYYADDKDTEKVHDFQTDKAGILFYDDTRIELIGRICGGKDQGEIPLGNSLSRNNLGDNLQMVLTLEGDNASRLVFDIQDSKKTTRDEVFTHKAHDQKYDYQTTVHTTLNRMVITPDAHTGEYRVLLPPVKWKVQQITAKGYPTLFQDGQVGDVLDLTDSVNVHTDHYEGSWKSAYGVNVNSVDVTYHAQYNRVYHSPVIIDYKQQGFAPFDFLGDQYYSFKNLTGDKQKLALAYGVRKQGWPVGKRDSLETVYTFGYPVFSIDRQYGLKISATEHYYYNNNTKSDTVDIIRLSGGEVTIHNGLVSSTHKDVVQLDSVGEANYTLEAAQTPYLLTGEDALRTVSMTLLMDGTHYEAEPLRAYVLNVAPKAGAKDILPTSMPMLVDILRDPPGGTSKATLSKGSTLKYSYAMDMKWQAGISIGFNFGFGMNTSVGVVAAPMGIGAVSTQQVTTSSGFGTSIDLICSGSGQRAFNYTMTATEDISTSTSTMMVGADADLYIGVEQNIVLKPATAIRAIPDSVYRQADGLLQSGRMLEIARGVDDQGKTLHLVRDEVVTYGPEIKSNFVHSQLYIVKQLIPQLREQCLSLIFTGTKEEAQARADATDQMVYLSLVDKDSDDFGIKYEKVKPSSWSDDKAEATLDEVDHYHGIMLKWMEMIAQNEKEKMTATELVSNYDVDGGSAVSYSETFSSDYTVMNSFVNPFTPMIDGYFDSTAGNVLVGIASILGPAVGKFVGSVISKKAGKGLQFDLKGFGAKLTLSFTPVASFSVTPKSTESKAYSRKESFTIGMDKKSHIDFDVYKVKTSTETMEAAGVMDVFTNANFNSLVDYDKDYLSRDLDLDDISYARSFVYRTRGGATCRPWEGERQTLFYNPGTVMDERTKKIENPVIRMDKQSLSGVPFDEPARFKLYLTNESEQPEAAYNYFDIYQLEKSNPKGAKMLIDGMPLTGNMRTIEVRPGQVTEKTLEVYAGEDFDYEGLKIGIISLSDLNVFQEVAFDVHYLQTAGQVAISMPGDKWIMNCDAPTEEGKGWYLPVVISGFNKNQHNFDHIEFQYKESTRGDDYWTNLCGFYADSLIYRNASGTKEMIPDNGNITTRFFGEGTVMEKAYDLRAVLFCRNGNAFLTSESKVLSGVKDTRRPQLFGTPEPKSGVIGAGDNIVFNFSEDIEYNYLQATTNFQVRGETNETAIQEAPSLQFGGNGYAQTEARRNFSDKSVTIEVMIRPDDSQYDMPIFSHGTDGNRLQLWLTADKKLKAIVDDKVLESKQPISTVGFQHVALVLDNDSKQLLLYGSDVDVLSDVTYSGYGPLTFGAANLNDAQSISFFEGNMLQGRVWNRAMSEADMNRYLDRLLTGYEMGLVDYYPMNEGSGTYSADQAQGAHLLLHGATWALPQGMSLRVDKNEARSEEQPLKGLLLDTRLFNRDDEQDYTLMFWFRTADTTGALMSNGSGRRTDVGARGKFFIGFENAALLYRSNGQEFALGDNLCDDAWHYYAMTVNRNRMVASIYVDNQLKAQFPTDSLGGIEGTRLMLGNMAWQEQGPDDATVHQSGALTGRFDGIALFEQALPQTLIRRYSTKSPGGSETGLKVYIDFDRQERQMNGDLVLQPYAYSKVVKLDNDRNDTGKRDSVFVNSVDEIMARIDQHVGAPVQAYEQLRNLNFSFVGRDNQLLVNIDEMDSRINKRTIYVTVADIPDKNGNFMASPQTASFFVNRNPLTWAMNRYAETLKAGVEHNIDLYILNNGGAPHTYQIENLPRWMSVSKTSDIIDAQENDHITLTISKDVNVGTFDNLIYLTDENGLSEPLYLELTIEGETPAWDVDQALKHYSMSVVGQVYVGNTLVTDSRDIVAAFDANGRCMGVNNVKYDAQTGRSMIYMTVYDSTTVARQLFFRLWHYPTGKTMQLTTPKPIQFGDQAIVGTIDQPVQMYADDLYLQKIELAEGWNWVSFYVYNQAFAHVPTLLGMFPWENGDIVTEDQEDLTLAYKDGQWLSNKPDTSTVSISPAYCYRVKVKNDQQIEFWGTSLRSAEAREIKVKQGWNSIGYTPMVNLPLSTALTEYFDQATPGDVIKSQHEFAMFASDGKGGGEWLGTLEYMKPGEGYMLYRHQAGDGSFRYPYYEPGTTFIDISSARAPRRSSAFSTTMTVVAQATGVDLQEGDRLIAFAGGEQVGSEKVIVNSEKFATAIDRSLFYLSIAGDQEVPLAFAIERDGDIIATTPEMMTYQANGISGTPSEPTQIRFVCTDQLPQTGWYTVSGIRLQKAPKQSGLYIYNGKTKVIK